MNPDSENETLRMNLQMKKSSQRKSLGLKLLTHSTLLKFAKSQPCIAAQEIIQIPISHSTFLQE
jgi:hypothetical protein